MIRKRMLWLFLVLSFVLVVAPLVYAGSANDVFDTKSECINDPNDADFSLSNLIVKSVIKAAEKKNALFKAKLESIVVDVREHVPRGELERFKQDWMYYVDMHKARIDELEKIVYITSQSTEQEIAQHSMTIFYNIEVITVAERALLRAGDKVLNNLSEMSNKKSKLKLPRF